MKPAISIEAVKSRVKAALIQEYVHSTMTIVDDGLGEVMNAEGQRGLDL